MGFICFDDYQECTFCGARFSPDCNPDGHKCKPRKNSMSKYGEPWRPKVDGYIGTGAGEIGKFKNSAHTERACQCVNAFAGCRSDVPEQGGE